MFQAYDANIATSPLYLEITRVACELALFGTRVGCSQLPCSACTMMDGECACKVWTCRCRECRNLRKNYRKIAGTKEDVMFYRTVDEDDDNDEPANRR